MRKITLAVMTLVMALTFVFLGPPAKAESNLWYVKPAGGSYGLENGTSPTNAWDGFADIDWNVLGAGDTLYLIGTFIYHLEVRSGGDTTGDLWIRGDHVLGAGVLDDSNILWDGPDSSYVTVYGVTINGGRVAYKTAARYKTGMNLLFVAPDTIRDLNKEFISSNFQSGQMIRVTGGNSTSNRWSYLIKSITDEGSYEEMVIESEGAAHGIVAEGPGPKSLEAIWPSHHLTIDNSYIQSTFRKVLVDIKGTNITIRNSELDGSGALSRAGVLYVNGRHFWRPHSNIIIEGNYIHGGSAVSTSDEHCIGVQGIDGILITRNRIADCGSGVVLWHGSTAPIKNYEITYNLIEGMDYNVKPNGWGGSAIVYTGSGTGSPDNTEGLVAGNVIRNPLNCPQGAENEWGACLGIRTKVEKVMRIYNNLIIGYDYGIRVEKFVAGDVKNNIVMDSGLHHVHSRPPGNFYEEDHNIYYPDSPSSFRYLGAISNFADYNDNHAVVVNQNSVIADPELNAAYQPSSITSPAIDAGVNVGYQHLISATWPTGSGGGAFVFGDDSASPDIGPFMFAGSDAGPDQTVDAGDFVVLDGSGSTGGENPLTTYDWMQIDGPLVVGFETSDPVHPSFLAPFVEANATLTFQLVVGNGVNFNEPDYVDITVVIVNIPPVANAGPDQTKEEGSLVTLNGLGSSDPDSNGTISYEWTQIIGALVNLSSATLPMPSFDAPGVGPGGEALTFSLIVTDDDSINPLSSAPDEVVINVTGIYDPLRCDLAVASKEVLLPANNKMEQISIKGVGESNIVTLDIIGVTQDEPVGNSSPDAVIQIGDPADIVLLRRERSKNGNGRVYEVAFIADDGFENCTGAIQVSVPPRRKSDAVDDGQIFDATQP